MSCQAERVTALVDGALQGAELAEVEAHVASCAACAEQAEAERDLRRRLRSLPPVEMRSGFEEELRRRLRGARPRRARWLLPIAAVLTLGYLWLRGWAPFVAWELSRDHAHCFGQEKLPAEILSGDPARVADWFEESGTRMPVIPAAVGALELAGGRYCPLPGASRAAHLYYASDGRRVSLFVVTRSVRLREPYTTSVRGATVRLARMAGTTVGLVGEHPQDVEAFRRALSITVAWKAP